MNIKALKSEHDLLLRVAEGNEHAFEMLFNQYHNKVYGYAYKIIQSQAAAEEIVQDVFIKIWVNKEALATVENFGGYLRTIARNHTLNALKKLAREAVAFAAKNINWTDADLNTEHQISYKDTRKVFDKALDSLPPQQKLVYSMCKVDGMKLDEVAQKLQISPLTVKAHLRQATQSIKAYMLRHSDVMSLAVFITVSQCISK